MIVIVVYWGEAFYITANPNSLTDELIFKVFPVSVRANSPLNYFKVFLCCASCITYCVSWNSEPDQIAWFRQLAGFQTARTDWSIQTFTSWKKCFSSLGLFAITCFWLHTCKCSCQMCNAYVRKRVTWNVLFGQISQVHNECGDNVKLLRKATIMQSK